MSEENVVQLSNYKEEKKPEKITTIKQASNNLKLEINDINVVIDDGYKFLQGLKKEAARQQAMKYAQDLEKQTRNINFLPTVESVSEEIALSETFEIIEE